MNSFSMDRCNRFGSPFPTRRKSRTFRDPFADNLYAEMGAEYIDKAISLLSIVKIGLEVLPAKQYDGIYLRGKLT
ncbi:MAG: hypothetical protein CM1200mP10_01890 [Candidatus Neomarinimicrobiota bacterium]|nr:MAG: hypothetical protein CM1200mP10_01890 [Candidatus Neomarinimicrobiota bacterium]